MKTIVLSLFLLTSYTLFAQQVIKGKITDPDGQPLAGATIKEKYGAATSSDDDGNYKLTIKDTKATILFTAVGYKQKEIMVKAGSIQNIQMEAEVNSLNAVGIVGSRSPNRSSLNTPVPVDIISVKKVLNSVGQLDINQLLQFAAPSFNANRQSGSDGADHVDPATLRGLGPDQTLVLVNGKRYHQSSLIYLFGSRGRGNTGTDLNTIPVSSIERIEILRDGAAAQYGSDAIAGVINIVLKSTTEQFTGNVSAGITGHGDGLNSTVGLNYGFKIKNDGFVNLSGDYNYRGRTNRSLFNSAPMGDIPRRYFGDALLNNGGFMLNSNIPLSKTTAFYAFGGYNRRYGNAYAWTRFANGLDRNIPSIYPNGFDPEITTGIDDITLTTGFKGIINDWNWDVSYSYGSNKFDYVIKNTLNASIGPNSPRQFNAGGFYLNQQLVDVGISRFFKSVLDAGTNLAFGAEYRKERYKILAGEDGSWKNYGYTQTDANSKTVYGASGSQGFPGFQPGDVTNNTRRNIAAYADAEFNFSKQFMVAVAARYENYTDFGNTLNGKLAARFTIAPQFTLRGSVSTGFRAPSLAQEYFSSSYTNVEGGSFTETKLAANNSDLAKEVGIPKLKQEKSFNASFGFTSNPIKGLTLTVDGYMVNIKDRIVLTGDFDATNTPAISSVVNSQNLDKVKFFTNAIDTKTLGLDAVISYNFTAGKNNFTASFLANFNSLKFGNIKTSGKLTGKENIYFSPREQSFVKASAPPYKLNLTLMDKVGKFSAMLRFINFAKVSLINYNEKEPVSDDKKIDVYHARVTTDATVSYDFSKKVQLSIGASNLFNVTPTVQNSNLTEGGGQWDPVQMGINGSFFFTKLSLNL